MNVTTSQFNPVGYSRPPARTHAKDDGVAKNEGPKSPAEALVPTELSQVERAEESAPSPDSERVKKLVEQLREAAEKANAYLDQTDTHLEFTVTERTGRPLVKVVDSETGEVIRQIPSERLLNIANRLSEMRGLLFDAKG